MRSMVTVTVCLSVSALTSCTGQEEEPGLMPERDSSNVSLEVQRDVMLTDVPHGDQVIHELAQGRRAIAICFVPPAPSEDGQLGSQVKMQTRGESGYAAVRDLLENSERRNTFDLDEEALRSQLPNCPE